MTLGSHLSHVRSPYRMLDSRLPHDDIDRGADMRTADGRALSLRSATLKAEAAGGIARVVLEQTFENTYDEPLKVTYKMPLPADGAISGYAFTVGGRVVEGRVEPKAKARETFEVAIAEGRTAGIVEQEKADIFTQEIGNIPARAMVVARITVDQRLAWLPEGEWELRFPTVIGPRYIGTTETQADARAVAVATSEAPLPVRLALDIHVRDALAPGRRIESPSHALDVTEGGRVSLRAKEGARLDRDVVVRWGVAKPVVGATLVTGKVENGTHGYGLLTIVPPSADARIAPLPRDLVVLLDTSGSMSGPPLELAKRVVAQVLDSLTERDHFEVIEFGDRPNRYHAEALAGTTARKRDAVRWVMSRNASGGTEMYSAVLEALRVMRPGAQRQVVLVTDGYIGGEQQIVRLCNDRLPASCRLHVVGVGAAANRALSTALARAGRGAEILVGVGEDAERASKRLLDRTAAPILTDVTIEGPGVVWHVPKQIPDVFAGAPLVCALRLAPEGGDITIRGRLAHGEWTQRVRIPSHAQIEANPAIVALFGREHVADLETEWSSGENQRFLDTIIEETGVTFQIATRLTSWVAVDKVVSVDPYAPSRTESIPQELPYGTTIESFGGPESGMATTRAGTLKGGLSIERLAAAYGAMPLVQAPASIGLLAADDEDLEERTAVRAPAPAAPLAPAPMQASYGAPFAKREAGPAPGGAPAPVTPPMSTMMESARLSVTSAPQMKRARRRWLAVLVAALVTLMIALVVFFLFFFFFR